MENPNDSSVRQTALDRRGGSALAPNWEQVAAEKIETVKRLYGAIRQLRDAMDEARDETSALRIVNRWITRHCVESDEDEASALNVEGTLRHG